MKRLFFTSIIALFCFKGFGQSISPVVYEYLADSKENKSLRNYVLYPNHRKNLITLEPRTPFRGYAEICSVEGTLIKKTKLKSREILDIDIKNLSAGQYMIKISDQDFNQREVFNFQKQ